MKEAFYAVWFCFDYKRFFCVNIPFDDSFVFYCLVLKAFLNINSHGKGSRKKEKYELYEFAA